MLDFIDQMSIAIWLCKAPVIHWSMVQQARNQSASTMTLPSDIEVRVERTFAAPIKKVWRAWTDPELFPKWLGYEQYKMTTSEFDAKTGGKYRWAWDIDGQSMVIHGDVLDFDAPARLATREFMEMGEPIPGYTLNLMLFNEDDSKTTVACHITFPTNEARDAALATGMVDGMEYSNKRLDALLKEL